MMRFSYWYQDICPCDVGHLRNLPLSRAFLFQEYILFKFYIWWENARTISSASLYDFLVGDWTPKIKSSNSVAILNCLRSCFNDQTKFCLRSSYEKPALFAKEKILRCKVFISLLSISLKCLSQIFVCGSVSKYSRQNILKYYRWTSINFNNHENFIVALNYSWFDIRMFLNVQQKSSQTHLFLSNRNVTLLLVRCLFTSHR